MFSAISVILRYHLNLDRMEMDVRRQHIDQPTPALWLMGFLLFWGQGGLPEQTSQWMNSFPWPVPTNTPQSKPSLASPDWTVTGARCFQWATWTGDAFIRCFSSSESGMPPHFSSMSVSCYRAARRALCSAATPPTSAGLCLGASLSPHLAPLILVCLEGDWR